MLQSRDAFARAAIGRDDIAQGIEGDEDFRLRFHVMAAAMDQQHPGAGHGTEEIAILDQGGALLDDAVDQVLAVARIGRADRRGIEHADQLT